MKFGTPFAAGLGSPECWVRGALLSPASPGLLVALKPAYDSDDPLGSPSYWHLYDSAALQQVIACDGSDDPPAAQAVKSPYATRDSLVLLRIGHGNDMSLDYSDIARAYEAEGADAEQATVQWGWAPDVIGAIGDGGFTSAWCVSWVSDPNPALYSLANYAGRPLWSQANMDITVAAGTATVTLASNGVAFATATGAVGTTLYFSGLAAAVAVSGSAVTTLGAILLFRWPSSANILIDGPVVANVPYVGQATGSWTSPLMSGDHDIGIEFVSDTGIVGDENDLGTADMGVIPDAPANVHYVSGDASSGVVLGFTPVDASITVNAYCGPIGGHMSQWPKATTAGDTGSITIPSAQLAGYPGVVYVLLRATEAGAEEKNLSCYPIYLDASGNRYEPPPNQAGIVVRSVAVLSDALSLQASYDSTGEATQATTIQLFTRLPSASYDFTNPLATAALSSGTIRTAALTATLPVMGLQWICVVAATAVGTQGAPSQEYLVEASDEVLASPQATLTVTRG